MKVMTVNKIKALLTRKYTKAEAIGIILSIVAIGIVVDIILSRFTVFFILLAIVLAILGYWQLKEKNTTIAYVLMIIGFGFLIFAFVNSFAFALIFAVLIIYNCYQLFRSSSKISHLELFVKPSPSHNEHYSQTEPFFKNKLVGEYRELKQGYAIEDINIQTGFGDILIDLTEKIIPEGETVILIRGMVGSIYLNIPSDVALAMEVSLLCGKTKLLDEESKTTINLTKKYQNVDYKNASRKIKIVVSLLVGDVEVKHQ